MTIRIASTFTLISIICLMGCTVQRPINTYEGTPIDGDGGEPCSLPAVDSFEFEYEERGVFISPDYTVYEAVLTYQEETDRLSNTTSVTMLSAKDAAEISYWVVKSYESLLKNPKMAESMASSDALYDLINYSHFHVLHQDDDFFWLWDAETWTTSPESFDDSYLLAFIRMGGCLPPAGDAAFTSFYRSRYYFTKQDPWVVFHELMHMVSLAATGDSDSDHVQEWLWRDYGEETVAASAEQLFLENHVE